MKKIITLSIFGFILNFMSAHAHNGPIVRGSFTKDQIGSGYTYNDSNGHGAHVYYDPTFGGNTYVDSW